MMFSEVVYGMGKGSVKMNFDQVLVTDGKKAVALKVFGDVVVDLILVEILALDEELGVISVFQHGIILLCVSFCPAADFRFLCLLHLIILNAVQ